MRIVFYFLLLISIEAFAQEAQENRPTDNPGNASYRVRAGNSFGSGTAISRNLLVTNAHVVGQVGNQVFLDQPQIGTMLNAHVIESDPLLDLALVVIDEGDLRWAEYSANDPTIGQRCKLYGYTQAGPLRASEGSVVQNARDSFGNPKLWLSIPVDSGDSGGGVFDSDNRLVAITNAHVDQGTSSVLPISLMIKLKEQYKSRALRDGVAFTETIKCEKCGAYHEKTVELTQL